MDQITVTLGIGNSAFRDEFTDEPNGYEIARILRDLAAEFEANGLGILPKPLRDVNGNPVGEVTLTETDAGA